MDHDAISEVRETEGGRGLKGALRVQFFTCWIWDSDETSGGTKQAVWHRSRPRMAHSLGSFICRSKVTRSARCSLNIPYRRVSPTPFYPALLSFCFLLLRSYYHLTRCSRFGSLPISPATRLFPSLWTRKLSILLTAVSSPAYLTRNKCSPVFVKWMEQAQESFKRQLPY